MGNNTSNISFFTVTKDGYNCYPESSYATFSKYYTNSGKDWFLKVEKYASKTTYTYVKYGLHSSSIDKGRGGSFFGFSIDFIDCYFNDFNKFIEIIESLIKTFIIEKEFLINDLQNEQITVKPFKLSEIREYLEKKSKGIQNHIETEYKENLISLTGINDSNGNFFDISPKTSQEILKEKFKKNGAINISPEFDVQQKTSVKNKYSTDTSINKDAEISELKTKVNDLTIKLKEKEEENVKLITIINQLIEVLQPYANSIKPIYKDDVPVITAFQLNSTYSWANKKWAKIAFFLLIIIVSIFSVIFYFKILTFPYWKKNIVSKSDRNSNEKVTTNSADDNSSKNPDESITNNDSQGDIQVIEEREKNSQINGYLNTKIFLYLHKDTKLNNIDDLKEILTDFLFKDGTVSTKFKNKEDLWENIGNNNARSLNTIKQNIERGDFRLKKDDFCENLFKDIVIYTKSEQRSENLNSNISNISSPTPTPKKNPTPTPKKNPTPTPNIPPNVVTQ